MFIISIAAKKEDGSFESWVDVSKYVSEDSLSDISIDTNLDDFSVGVAKTSSFDLSILNDNGLFADESNVNSMFKHSRNGSLVRIEYFANHSSIKLGEAICGESVLGDTKVNIFEGIIDEIATRETASDNFVDMTILGKESIFDRVEKGVDDLNTSDTVRILIMNLLEKKEIKGVLDIYSGRPYWSINVDFKFSSLEDFENADTVQECLDIILRASNAILLMQDNVVYLHDRVATYDFKFEFFSPFVEGAVENIIEIENFSSGINRTFNLWADESDTGYSPVIGAVRSPASIEKYGVRKNSVDVKGLDRATMLLCLTSYFDEFAQNKIEMDIKTPLNKDSILLKLFDKVRVNFPSEIISAIQGEEPPRWDQFYWDESFFPFENVALTVDRDKPFKVQKIEYDLDNEIITLSLREV